MAGTECWGIIPHHQSEINFYLLIYLLFTEKDFDISSVHAAVE